MLSNNKKRNNYTSSKSDWLVTAIPMLLIALIIWGVYSLVNATRGVNDYVKWRNGEIEKISNDLHRR